MPVKHKYNPQAMAAILKSPHGGLAKDMARRGIKVTAMAKKNLSRPPTRVNTGYLRASINWKIVLFSGYPGVRIGTPVNYARWVHDGTGIYGPRGLPITPKTAKMLVWQAKKGGKLMFAKTVKGMRPNPFLRDALPAAVI